MKIFDKKLESSFKKKIDFAAVKIWKILVNNSVEEAIREQILTADQWFYWI